MSSTHAYPATQVSVSTSAPTLIRAANKSRSSILLVNLTGSQLMYFNTVQGVTASNGVPLAASVGSNVTLYSQDDIWGLSASSAQTISVWEEYTDK